MKYQKLISWAKKQTLVPAIVAQTSTVYSFGRNDSALKRAEPVRPRRLRIRSLWAPSIAVAIFAVFAALMVMPLQAQGQTTLVSNTGQTPAAFTSPVDEQVTRAQGFTTGDNAGGYTLSSVQLALVRLSNGDDEWPVVSIYEANAAGTEPGSSRYTLTNPDTMNSIGLNTFTAPLNATLENDTKYFVVAAATSGYYTVYLTGANAEDSGGASGWRIANRPHNKSLGGAWTTRPAGTENLRISVIGDVIITAPGAPGDLTATASSNSQIDLSWTAPADNGGTDITGYRIEVSADGGTIWSDLVANTGTTTTSYSHTGLSASSTRHYRVSAINDIGTGPVSDLAGVTTPIVLVSNTGQTSSGAAEVNAGETTYLAIQAQGFTTGDNTGGYTLSSVRLGFASLFSTPAPKVSIYEADASGNPGSIRYTLTNPSRIARTGFNTFTAPANATLEKETTYFVIAEATSDVYRVSVTNSTAEDLGGASGWSIYNQRQTKGSGTWTTTVGQSNMLISVIGDVIVTAPGAPTDLTATAGSNSQIDLSWTAPADDGGADITGYRIEVSEDDGANWSDLVANTGTTDTTYPHTGLSRGSTRHYRVSAINSAATGPVSDLAVGANFSVPGAPTDLTATGSSETQVDLSWTAPADGGGADITGYRIEVSEDDGTSWSDLVANTGTTDTTYPHTGLSRGSTRHYRVSAINSAGTGPASDLAVGAVKLPWDDQTVYDVTVQRTSEIANPGDTVWYSLPNIEQDGLYRLRYLDTVSPGDPGYGRLIVRRPKMQVYNSDGSPVIQHGFEVADELPQRRSRLYRLPEFVFMPQADGTYYMSVSSLSNDVGEFKIRYKDRSLGSPYSDRSGDTINTDCRAGANTRCKMKVPGANVEGNLTWRDVDRYKFAVRKGGDTEICTEFLADPIHGEFQISSPITAWVPFAATEAGTYCTEFDPNHTGMHEIRITSFDPMSVTTDQETEYRNHAGISYTINFSRE